MADLTSCFFCGDVDDRLIEHPVVPEEMGPTGEAQRTVEVCTSCRAKLVTVQEVIVDAVGTRDDERTARDTGGERTARDTGGEWMVGDADGREGDAGSGSSAGSILPGTDSEGDEAGETDRDGDRPAGSEGRDGDGRRAERRSELPGGARQIVRLLQNREFPVERSEIEAVATSAYDLGVAESGAAIDALVEEGVLHEERGLLYRSAPE